MLPQCRSLCSNSWHVSATANASVTYAAVIVSRDCLYSMHDSGHFKQPGPNLKYDALHFIKVTWHCFFKRRPSVFNDQDQEELVFRQVGGVFIYCIICIGMLLEVLPRLFKRAVVLSTQKHAPHDIHKCCALTCPPCSRFKCEISLLHSPTLHLPNMLDTGPTE